MSTPLKRPAAAMASAATPTPPKRPAPSVATGPDAASLAVGVSSDSWARSILMPIDYDTLMEMAVDPPADPADGRVLLILREINGWYSTFVDRSSTQWLLLTPTAALNALGVRKGDFGGKYPIFLTQVRQLSAICQVNGVRVKAAKSTKFLGFCTAAVLDRVGA